MLLLNTIAGLSARLPAGTAFGHLIARRGRMQARKNIPFRGLYRTEGDVVRKDDLLVCQHKFNYHPGLNVRAEPDRGQWLLKADVDGRVVITTERVQPDLSHPEMATSYSIAKGLPEIQKLHFNVVPLPESNTFRLINTV